MREVSIAYPIGRQTHDRCVQRLCQFSRPTASGVINMLSEIKKTDNWLIADLGTLSIAA